MASTAIDDLLDPAFLDGLAGLPLGELRRRRTAATGVETELSYLRRIVQGRLDIVLAERQRRDSGQASLEAGRLVEQLPSILSERGGVSTGGRLPSPMAPEVLDQALVDGLDAVFPPERLTGLGQVGDTDLDAAVEGLAAYEREVSGQRRSLHEVIDRLQEELIRRYRSGEATVDGLLP